MLSIGSGLFADFDDGADKAAIIEGEYLVEFSVDIGSDTELSDPNVDGDDVKWNQPPEPAYPDNVYLGWNEYSVHESGQIGADDWVCTTDAPITEVAWWGSFINWEYADSPTDMPDYFHVAIWTDVPAGADQNYSHPGMVVYEADVHDYAYQWVGWDYDPRAEVGPAKQSPAGDYESCFRFDASLPEWFYQDPVGTDNIYWVSIAAGYNAGTEVDFPFGWKTRPRDTTSPAPDDAVVIWNPTGAHRDDQYQDGHPLWWPTPEESWDFAFELLAMDSGPSVKWEQQPDLSPYGMDVLDGPGFNHLPHPEFPVYEKYLADDFRCTQTGPITQIEFWGSYLDDLRGDAPPLFNLAIFSDIPADESPTDYSMPGEVVWNDYLMADLEDPYAGAPEGFFDPNVNDLIGADNEVWKYTFHIDPAGAFEQQEGTVYWLGVSHSFDLDGTGLVEEPDMSQVMQGWSYGWKTSEQHWNDKAVFTDVPSTFGDSGKIVPQNANWRELVDPRTGGPLDLSFVVTTEMAGEPFVKWSQPPEPYVPRDAFYGWDEYSVYGNDQIVADDWLCETDQPVTDVHWWGSFLGWYEGEVPWDQMPGSFHLGIWTDVPSDPADPESYSHPGEMVWENRALEYRWEFAGWDFDPRDPMAPPEATFYFEYDLPQEDWFWQDAGDNIYWISIAAVYPDTTVVEHPFGWKTRPRDLNSPAPDDAVRIWNPTNPTLGSGGPVITPTNVFPTPGGLHVSEGGIGFGQVQTEIVSMKLVASSQVVIDPPPAGETFPAESFFDVYVEVELPSGEVYVDSFFDVLTRLEITGLDDGPVSYYETQIVAMDLGGSASMGLMFRESPDLPSMGGRTTEELPSGDFAVDSFFDVFFELSVDGGETWAPADGPLHVVLTEPRVYVEGEPIEYPDGISWDMAFVLTTQEIQWDPAIDVEKATNGQDADLPTGPVVPVGSVVTWDYQVTNPGNAPLSGVVVIDDAGTPLDNSDDFNPGFTGGDDGNGLLDLGEIWTYQATGIAQPGQYGNVSYVSGQDPSGTVVADNDPSHYFGRQVEKLDWGDAPDSVLALGYPTLAINGGAHHVIVDGGPWLGDASDGPDADPNGQPDGYALGDDYDVSSAVPNDDEDGVLIPMLEPGKPEQIRVEVNGPGGVLQAWVDWNGDRSWDASEQIVGGPVSPGVHMLNVMAPLGTPVGSTFARFRISTNGAPNGPLGRADDGEVEDHQVFIVEPPDNAKWVQWPDLTPNGIDIKVDDLHWVGDDFQCTSTSLLTDVHFWGSWLDDFNGRISNIHLEIHHDDPVGDEGHDPNNEWSQPDPEVIWLGDFGPGQFQEELVFTGRSEYWWDPAENVVIPEGDHEVWQIDVQIDPDEAFEQRGTEDNPIIYWLVMQVQTEEGQFGWKTREYPKHFMDDAVFDYGSELPRLWKELRYPEGHPYHGHERDSIDMAFMLTFEEPELPEHDLGDAPDSSHSHPVTVMMTAYPGVLAHFPTVYQTGSPPHGPIHWQPKDLAFLGDGVTRENEADIGPDEDGVNNIDPPSDVSDQDGADDGVHFPLNLVHCQQNTFDFDVTVTNFMPPTPTLYVNAWFDFTHDGDWDDQMQCPNGPMVDEWAVQNQTLLLPGVGTYTITSDPFLASLPATGVDPSEIWMRITLSEQPWDPIGGVVGGGGAGPAGGYQYGETEDYLVPFEVRELDWGDAPDGMAVPRYPTLAMNNGANHLIGGPWLGDATDVPDAEPNGQPDPNALGDDNDTFYPPANDDEDGVQIPPLVPGYAVPITVEVNGSSAAGSYLDAWVDFNGNKVWEAAEQIHNGLLPNGVHTIWVTAPPANSVPGQSFARFRISNAGGLSPMGFAPDGEVEDHEVRIEDVPENIKWTQLPDVTPNGIDIRVDEQHHVADDFECNFTSLLTNVSFWGSWRDDLKGEINNIRLQIYDDDPVGLTGSDQENRYSKPEPESLWAMDFGPNQFREDRYYEVPDPGEWWWDPADGTLIRGGDRGIWLIDIPIDPRDAFVQRGTPEDPVIYWLHVSVDTEFGEFGWKTRQWPDHYMDDAVWDVGSELPRLWSELRYPEGHPYHGLERDSIDMAFALGFEEARLDWGDAPGLAGAIGYPTLAIQHGANHVVRGSWLGDISDAPDAEPDGQPDPNALGDDNDILYPPVNDDEDGITWLTPLIPGNLAKVAVVTTGPGVLNAWIDFGGDGSWAEPGDQIFVDRGLAGGANSLSFVVPASASPETVTYARFRYSSAAGLSYTGPAPDGEVEDHEVFIGPDWEYKWEQPPESADPQNVYYGWNETSLHENPDIPFAADDWVCTTDLPVTDLTWWGSFLQWSDADQPPIMPDYFHLAIWTDVPAGWDAPYSHPGRVVWEEDCSSYDTEFVGWDFDPMTETYEACFQFDQELETPFEQLDPQGEGIYWLSIAAAYPGSVAVENPWGWKTRPREPNSPAPDAAVRVYDPIGAHMGELFGAGQPIHWGEQGEWDLAFELISQPPGMSEVKWQQLPDLEYGMDVLAGPGLNRFPDPPLPTYEKFLADDFLCTSTGPITEIGIWGSYLFDHRFEEPPLFNLAIYSDVPAEVSPTGYSIPGDVLWSKYVAADTEKLVADQVSELFYDPNIDEIVGNDTQVWLYRFLIDPAEAFVQQEGEIYWLGVHHSFDLDGNGVVDEGDMFWVYERQWSFGWKTTDDHFNDDGVFIDVNSLGTGGAIEPPVGPWRELVDPRTGLSLDLAFYLVTETDYYPKWTQDPDPRVSGLHAHDWKDTTGYYQAIDLADQWICQGGDVTDLHWFGGYEVDINGQEMRGSEVDYFHLSIHENQPGLPWDLPGTEVWFADVPLAMLTEINTGLVNNVAMPIYQYGYILPEPFEQIPGEIYWFDVEAHSIDPANPALWIWQEAQRGNPPIVAPAAERTYVAPPGAYTPWQSIQWGFPDPSRYSDMAFWVTSKAEPVVKWSQRPAPYVPDDAYNGWDEPSIYRGEQIVGDDWVCTTLDPVTDVHWWGSFIGWDELEVPEMPRGFHIGIWTDSPAGEPDPFSHPEKMIWEWYADTSVIDWKFVGWDFDPRDPLASPEATFLFDYDVPENEWFWQQSEDATVYWITIAADYGDDPGAADYPFGWKTRPRDPESPAPDDAVRIFDPTAPVVGDPYVNGEPIYWPDEARSWDMAFMLTTKNITTLFWDELGDAEWSDLYPSPPIPPNSHWVDAGGNPVTVYPDDSITNAVVRTDRVSVATDRSAHDLRIASGALEPSGTTTVNLSGNLQIVAPGEYAVVLDGASNSLIAAMGNAYLDGKLSLQGASRSVDIYHWADETRTIITAAGPIGVSGSFATTPSVIPPEHLGHGVFFTGITYGTNAVTVDVLQARGGDTDGDHDVDFADFNNLANNYTGPAGSGKDWIHGDFDGDGDVDFGDFNTLANNYTGPSGYHKSASTGGDLGKVQAPDLQDQSTPAGRTASRTTEVARSPVAARDAVFERAARARTASPSKMEWICEVEPSSMRQRSPQRSDPAKSAVDQVLLTTWR